jgi:hypothetical protein
MRACRFSTAAAPSGILTACRAAWVLIFIAAVRIGIETALALL